MAAASTSTPNMSLTSRKLLPLLSPPQHHHKLTHPPLTSLRHNRRRRHHNNQPRNRRHPSPSTTGSASGLPIATGVTVGAPAVNVPTQVAVLTLSDTTLTAYAVPSTTGLAVLNGQTLTFRHEGITLSDGNVVSLGFNGLVESTTTATYAAVTDVSASSYVLPTGPGPVIFNSTFPSLEPTTTSGATLTGEQSSGMTTLTMSQSGSGSGVCVAYCRHDCGWCRGRELWRFFWWNSDASFRQREQLTGCCGDTERWESGCAAGCCWGNGGVGVVNVMLCGGKTMAVKALDGVMGLCLLGSSKL